VWRSTGSHSVCMYVYMPFCFLLFFEIRNRRKSATKILREKRGLSRTGIIKFGFQRKVKSNGIVVASGQFLINIISELARLTLYWSLRIGLIFPVQTIRRILKQIIPSSKKNNKETMSKFVE
jgi:hypothetical protein